MIPEQRSASHVECQQVQVGGRYQHLVAVQSDSQLGARASLGFVLVAPQHVAGGGVECQNGVGEGVQEHDTVQDQRYRHART